MTAISPWLLRLARVALLVVLFFVLLFTIVAVGAPTTGMLEKAVLVVIFFGLLELAVIARELAADTPGVGRSVVPVVVGLVSPRESGMPRIVA